MTMDKSLRVRAGLVRAPERADPRRADRPTQGVRPLVGGRQPARPGQGPGVQAGAEEEEKEEEGRRGGRGDRRRSSHRARKRGLAPSPRHGGIRRHARRRRCLSPFPDVARDVADAGAPGIRPDGLDGRVAGPATSSSASATARPSRWPIRRRRFGERLASPTGSPPLAELARGRKDACIVICDITRPVPNADPARPASRNARSRRHPARPDPDPRGHRPAPPEHAATNWSRWSARGSPTTIGSRTTTASDRDEHVYLGESPARRADLDRPPLRRGRSEDHHRADRAALHGRFLRRPEADLPGHRRAGDDPGLAQPAVPRTSQRPKRLPRRQPGPRGEHVDRPARRLRLHRQRGDRRPAADPVGRGRRHGGGASPRASRSSARS